MIYYTIFYSLSQRWNKCSKLCQVQFSIFWSNKQLSVFEIIRRLETRFFLLESILIPGVRSPKVPTNLNYFLIKLGIRLSKFYIFRWNFMKYFCFYLSHDAENKTEKWKEKLIFRKQVFWCYKFQRKGDWINQI